MPAALCPDGITLMKRITQKAFFSILAGIVLCSCSHSEAPSRAMVRLVSTRGTFGHLPVHLANNLGYFRDEGIELIVTEVNGATKVMEALLGGNADIATGALEQSIQMAAEGRQLQSFVTEFFNFGFSLVTSPKASLPIHHIEDLRGAKIGVGTLGSQSHLLANFLLSRHSLTTADFSTIAVGLGASSLASLEQGRVDAGIVTPNILLLLQKRHPETMVLFDPRPEDAFAKAFGVRRYPSHVLFAHASWIHNNRSTVRGVARAVVRALHYVASNTPETVISKVPAPYRSEDVSMDIAAMQAWKPLYSPDGSTPPAAFDAVKRFTELSLEKVRSAKIDAAAVYTNEFLEQGK